MQKSIVDPTIKVFHVGGRGGMGPSEYLLRLGESLSLSVFEANIESGDSVWDDYKRLIADYAKSYGIKLSMIPKCLSNCVGKKEFHVNVMPDCSSLLNMSPESTNYSRMNSWYKITWGQICRPKRTIKIDVTTLDELYANGTIQLPHFLSIDAQGAEYDILEGAAKALQSDLLGVVTEVEFREVYDGQKLFTDQYTLLSKHEFRMFELFNPEYWYSSQIIGKGALSVAEALFLRDYKYFVKKEKEPTTLLSILSKLAIVAYCFNRTSYTFEILEYIMDKWQQEWGIFIKNSDCMYLHTLMTFYRQVKSRQPRMEKVPTYSEYVSMRKSTRRLRSCLNFACSVIYNFNLKTIFDRDVWWRVSIRLSSVLKRRLW